jgi:S1-C subfamily serine protease
MVLRDGREISAEVQLIAAPDSPPMDRRQINKPGPFRDLIVANLNPVLNERIKAPVSSQGVVVLEVGKSARRSGWRPGDVIVSINGRPVASTEALEEESLRREDAWDVSILRGGRSGGLRFKR